MNNWKMSSFLCFICHNTVHDDTNVETREKYRELVGIKLCPDSHLCHICCHMLNKLWLFKTICVRRSMEYPVLFSDKGTISLHNSNTKIIILCPKTDECNTNTQTNSYHFTSNNIEDENNDNSNQYVSLEDGLNINIKNFEDEGKEINENDNNHFNNDNYDNEFEATDQNNEENPCTEQDDANDKLESTDDKNKDFHKIILSVEEQRTELEAKRREDRYLEAEFKCYNCALGFLFKDTYQAHMMRHEESNGEHVCDICTLRFASAGVLRAHASAHRERVACARCGGAVRPRRLAAHRAVCAQARPSALPCHLCGNTFPDASGLQQHMRRFHLAKSSGRSYCCSVCGKRYGNRAAVRTHMIKHINRKFTCDQCPSTFSSPYTLAQHKKKHSTDEEYRCETCNVTYKSKKSLLAHFRNSMSHQQTIFTCPICARPCPHRRALASHMQTVHSSVKPHACALCPARYSSRKSLAAHARAHAPRTRQCVCHLCGARFKGNNKLNRHLRSVCEKEKLEELSAFYNQ